MSSARPVPALGRFQRSAGSSARLGTPPGESNILLIRLKSIGDILFTLAAVRVVRENFPDAKIHFLVSAEHATLLRGFADVDEVIALDRAIYRSGQWGAALVNTFALLRKLRRMRYSHVIDFQGYGETEFLAWWTGAPVRLGTAYRRSRGWTYTHRVWRNDDIQIADWNLALIASVGLRIGPVHNDFVVPAESLRAARDFFSSNRLDETKPTLFIQPFTSSPHKNWPLHRFIALASHWQTLGVQVIFGGGPADVAALASVRTLGFPICAGAPMLVSAGVIQLSTLVVGGVTGLLHLAVALRKRVVMLVGCPDCEPGFPFQHRDWAVTAPAGKPVSEIATSTVVAASVQAFAQLASLAPAVKAAGGTEL